MEQHLLVHGGRGLEKMERKFLQLVAGKCVASGAPFSGIFGKRKKFFCDFDSCSEVNMCKMELSL
jgi:hypothetical protein